MFSFVYNLSLLLLALLMLPKLLWQWCVHGKYRQNLKARLGISLPSFTPQKGQEVIWIHAVSMGETRAVILLFRKIRAAYPNSAVLISTTTETGHAEAKRSMPEADAHFFLPIDFSWSIRSVMQHLQPTRLILCESDFWYHLLKIAKERGVKIDLVNGKVSERSCRRFQKCAFFTRKLFAHFDLLCVQSDRYRDRFVSLGIPKKKIYVTGNLKFDSPAKKMEFSERAAFKESLGLATDDQVLVIGSTHAPEEDKILSALSSVWKKFPDLKVILAPRHPERFHEVAHLILQKGIDYCSLSGKKKGNERLVLIDTMGKLNPCYQIADVAIVGGSYTAHVGGHNIFEPIVFGVPVLFGPHMHNQPDLEEIVLTSGSGKKVNIEQLSENLIEILEKPDVRRNYAAACHRLSQSIQGATERTFAYLFPFSRDAP
jgi:3-deoxy-D-manno-octulosonic-acid transferase